MLTWDRLGPEDCLRLRGGAASAGSLAVLPANAFAAPDRPGSLPTMAGHWVVDGDDLCFVPRFGFAPGTPYAVVAGHDDLLGVLTRSSPEAAPTTTVEAIAPDVASLPRNALRLAISFSAPMSEGFAATHVRVETLDGQPVAAPFAPIDPELWDASRRHLTVLFDPARLKRGLRPHREAGYPLVIGTSVRVVVDGAWRDAAGQPLVAGLERRYDIGEDERRRVDPSAWIVEAPAAGSTDALVVRFDRPLDATLLGGCLRVDGVGGEPGVAVGQDAWSWRPARPWSPGWHRLVVEPRLEDLAGNSVARVFDRDIDDEVAAMPPLGLPFEVAGSPRLAP